MKHIILAGIACLILTTTAHAQHAVYDAQNNANQLKELSHMVSQLDEMRRQYEQLMEQTEAMTGERGMGDLLNGGIQNDMRHYTPDQMRQLLDIQNQSGLPASTNAVRGSVSGLRERFNPASANEIDPDNPDYAPYQAQTEKANTTYAAMAVADGAYDTASERTNSYETMLDQLNNTADLKASIDLQTRANVENGLVLNELTKLMALQTRLLASQANEEVTSRRAVIDANTID